MKGRSKEAAAPPHADGGFFVLRSPLLPLDTFYAWGEGLEATGDEAALARDAEQVRARLRALVARPEIREALFVASPSVEESLVHWLDDPDGERGQKVERSLVKYLARMAMRSTPFGLCAGGSLGRVSEESSLVVGRPGPSSRKTRLDGDYLDALCRALTADPTVRAGLTVRPNSSLYQTAGRLRLAEARLAGKVRSYHLVAVESDQYLAAALERASHGARPGQVAAHLCELDPDISLEEASGFVDELIDNQLLVPDLTPAVTGPGPLDDMLEQLAEVPEAAPVVAALTRTRDAIAALDESGLGNDPARYRAIATDLAALPAAVELPRLFQVDLTRPAPELFLSRQLMEDIGRGLALMHRLSPPQQDEMMSEFRQQLTARYESREVPLVEVMDEESGIGFGRSSTPGAEAAPLLLGIPFPGTAAEPRAPVGAPQRHLAALFAAALSRGDKEVVLGDQDIEAMASTRPPPVPDAFQSTIRIGAASPEALARGDYRIYLGGGWGPSGAMMLGRFCHADPDLFQAVLGHLRAEEAHRPDAIYAEIVHLPEGRLGNVIFRPVLRDHEIPFLGRSGAPPERQIPVTDLMVSVRGSRVVIRSRRLDREIVPRLTTAHNWRGTGGLGLYRFLCAAQLQSGASGIDFGALDLLPFRPRVRSGRFVLAQARWRVDKRDLERLGGKTRSARFTALQELRRRHDLPRTVLLLDGDNHLPIDLENVLSAEALIALVKDRPSATFSDIAPGPDEAILRGPDGRYQHEIVIPFQAPPRPASAPPPARTASDPVRRFYPPGSEWLYAKLYSGTGTADQVLREVVTPLVARMRQEGLFERWFFIRYEDPDHHIRLRFRGDPRRLAGDVLPALHEAAAALYPDGRIAKLQLDTYEPELDRYGGPLGVDLAERMFAIDSDASLAILDLLGGDEGLDAAWRLTLVGIDQLFRDLGLDLEGRLAIARDSAAMLRREFGSGEGAAATAADRALGDRFRRERKVLEDLLDPARRRETVFAPGVAVLDARSQALAEVITALHEAEASGKLTSSVRDMAWSYAHMHANRMLRSAPRAQEMVLYDFLARLYQSQVARGRKKS